MTSKTKRRDKHLSLNPACIKYAARDFVDFDYIAKLSPEEKDWLNKFSDEYYQASFKKGEQPLHKTPEERRAVYATDNARRRDLYANFQRADKTSEVKDEAQEAYEGVHDKDDK